LVAAYVGQRRFYQELYPIGGKLAIYRRKKYSGAALGQMKKFAKRSVLLLEVVL
jgi:hypothetical protein